MGKIGIIGAGVMGGAFAKGLSSEEVLVCDRNPEKAPIQDPNELIPQVETVVLALRPDSFDDFASNLSASMEDKLIISIMSGITIEQLMGATGSKRVVRAMPNLAVLTGAGVTGWVATPETSQKDRDLIGTLLAKMGTQIELEKEALIDSVAAISGSGPAYFFFMAEQLAVAGEKLGIAPAQALRLAERTLVSAGSLLAAGEKGAAGWREAITVPGGTTALALAVLREGPFGTLISDAAAAAYHKATDLGQ